MRAAESAQLLLKSGDLDGAFNRAYYAMFDGARAALMASSAPVEAEVARTCAGLISAFSDHLIKTSRVSKELGRALNRAEEIRLVADERRGRRPNPCRVGGYPSHPACAGHPTQIPAGVRCVPMRYPSIGLDHPSGHRAPVIPAGCR